MKVLAEGKWKKPWSMEVVCSEKDCGAKLLVEESDVKAVDNSSPADYFVKCAVCGEVVYVKAAFLPKWVKGDADKGKKYWNSGGWD